MRRRTEMGPWKERAWRVEEVALLRELYPLSARREILERMKGRTWCAIQGKAQSLKIRRLRQSESLPF